MADAVETPVETTEAPETQTVTVTQPVKMKYAVKEADPSASTPDEPVDAGDDAVETEPVVEATEEAVETNLEEIDKPAASAPTRLTKWRKADNTFDEDRLEQLEKIAEQQASELQYRIELEKKDPSVKRAILLAHKNAGGTLKPEDEAFLVPEKAAMTEQQMLTEFNRIELQEGTAKANLWWHNNVTVPSQEQVVRKLTKAERDATAKENAEKEAVRAQQASVASVKTEVAQAAKKFPKLFKENKENDFGFDLVNKHVEAELQRLKMDGSISVTERVEIALDRIARRNKKPAQPQAPLRSTPGTLQRPSKGGATLQFRVASN